MSKLKIWHNPKCSKSREAKSMLEDKNQEFEVFEYLKEDITKDELKNIIKMLCISDIREMLRTKEDEYKELGIAEKNLSQEEIMDIVLKHPKLIERPIIIKGSKAVIARPMERLAELIG
ncbi:MAG: arsenate reductase (glutaredoxin) [Sulfurimonas sp. RIFOXYD12_FULL_33_39]|uniref:arsenate reductase (glutaredoxin) n=1 Tax=unclassified Sulfurimonas TaxID=2623549 RepID=UPI0008C04DBA|nr:MULTISPECIES: arsenate reductase (glutaredoxin) [unclassified Sulfurimonas]OHE10200.1 MAG: arsenate reductase (glutaredoxin) [Sulfurimonas sp. RIFOXYD12_FULL_33_39]OHE14579.1 MAG: arsenate reductase (glutaredoxin) [Sulfurimonas sp. RIFOXYD2_FULL_34_21]DAB28280.1 MAG TPA: arsenate reductase (glutaredoxin) [Sulfurimonas sp. UBA10385]